MKRTFLFVSIFITAFLIALNIRSAGAVSQFPIGSRTNLIQNPTMQTALTFNMDWYFESGQDGAELGFSVSSAGDVNGDGYDDVIIGSPKFTPSDPESVYREGAAFVFYGSATGLKAEPDWLVGSGQQGSLFGFSVSNAGDVNGDGFDDVIVGAIDYPVAFDGVTGEPKSGAAFLYLGSAEGLSATADWMQFAEKREIAFGFSVASAGDVNHDGYDDVVIGAPQYGSSVEQSSEGKAYLYLGSEDGLEQNPVWSFECNSANSKCGQAVSTAGDINKDGFADIIIGAPYYDRPLQDEGAVLLFFGSPQGLGDTADQIINNGQAGAEFGKSVAAAGDVNWDGYDDVIIGAPRWDQDIDRTNYGAAFIYLGSPTGPNSVPDWVSYGFEEYSEFGHSVGTAGDVDQDGFSDVIVGAYKYGQNGEENQPDEGAVYLFTGTPTGARSGYVWAAYGNKAETEFGRSTGITGDINGDGKVDLIVGAPQYRFDEKTVMGRAFVFLNVQENHKIFIPCVEKSK